MHSSEMSDSEKMVFQTGIFDGLTVQDSFTIIALYAAQLDPEDCEADIDRIMALLNSEALFSEEHSISRDRINKFQNSIEKEIVEKTIDSTLKKG